MGKKNTKYENEYVVFTVGVQGSNSEIIKLCDVFIGDVNQLQTINKQYDDGEEIVIEISYTGLHKKTKTLKEPTFKTIRPDKDKSCISTIDQLFQ